MINKITPIGLISKTDTSTLDSSLLPQNLLLFRMCLSGRIYKDIDPLEQSKLTQTEYQAFLEEIYRVKNWGIDFYQTNYNCCTKLYIWLPFLVLPIIAAIVILFFYELAHWILMGAYIL